MIKKKTRKTKRHWIKSPKCFDLAKIVVPVIVAGLFTTVLTRCYQAKDEERQTFAKARDSATQTCYTLIDAMGDRHFYAYRAAVGIQWKIEAAQRWTEYEDAVKRWNKNRYSMLALANRYFGEETEEKIYILIKEFGKIHDELTDAKNLFAAGKPVPDLDKTLHEIYQLDDDISNFSKDLQQRLKEGKVDIYSPKPPITKPIGVNVKH